MAYELENLTANCRDALSECQQIEASKNVNDAMQKTLRNSKPVKTYSMSARTAWFYDVVDTRKSIAENLA